MGIRDVAGVSRPGVFERIALPTGGTVAPVRGTAASVTFRAEPSGQEYRGPNVSSAHTQEYVAQSAGAVKTPSESWPTPYGRSSR